jgi:hypothetical protein
MEMLGCMEINIIDAILNSLDNGNLGNGLIGGKK